ncbi:MAG: response regulator [Aquisalinus sp.]|nr:response regulator [Aquisalinus sp.]
MAELDKALSFVPLSAAFCGPIFSAMALFIMSTMPVEAMFIIAGWMTMMACISSISMCATPFTAKIIMVTLMLPANLMMVFQDDYRLQAFGAVMILSSLLVIGCFSTVMRVVTQIKEQALQNAERSRDLALAMQNYFDMSDDIVWETDRQLNFTFISDAIETFSGQPAHKFLNRSPISLLNKEDQETSGNIIKFKEAVESASPFHHLVVNVVTDDGNSLYADVSGAPVFDEAGELTGYRGVMTNITRLMHQRNDIIRTRERFRDFAELAADCLWETDANHRYTYISDVIEKWTGQNAEDLLGKKRGEVLENSTPETSHTDWATHIADLEQKKPFQNFIVRTHNNDILSTSGKPKFDANGVFTGYRGYTKEITREHTARLEANAAQSELQRANLELEKRIKGRTLDLQRQTDLLQEIFDTMGESLVVLDQNFNIEMINEKEDVPLPPGQWRVGANAIDLYESAASVELPGTGNSCSIKEQNRRLIENLRSRKAFRIKRLDVSGQHISEVFYPRPDGGYVILYSDVTRDMRREEELRGLSRDLRKSRDLAEEANRAKSEFLANMSHEIRTPMNGVLGMAELLIKSGLTDRQHEMAQVIMRSGDSLLTIINDILDFSKLEAGKMAIGSEPFDMRAAIEDVASLVSPHVQEKGLELMIRYQPDLPQDFIGDVGRLRQVITNLVGNAVKFTESGHILVDVSGNASQSHAELCISVEDTGCGIPQEKLDKIFNKFEQVDGSNSRKFEGTGLGLSISRKIIELMGGTISVRSDLDSGSTFFFNVRLPIDSQKPQQSSIVTPVLSGTRVLVADDNKVNRTILQEQLRSWSLVPVLTTDGFDALQKLEQARNDGQPFGLAILDFQMPEMDGAELARKIRQSYSADELPMILLSSAGQTKGQNLQKELDLAGYLVKPARSSHLLDTIICALHSNTVRGLQEASAKLKREAPEEVVTGSVANIDRHILVAEDNTVNQMVLRSMLEPLNCRVDIAENGQVALDKLQENTYDLVLMDVSMPVMDGLKATTEIVKLRTEGMPYVPVIGVTAHAMKEDEEKCLAAGMDGYMPKPIKQDKLLAVVTKWIDERKQDNDLAETA